MEKYDVFISCKSEDYPHAEQVYDFLKANHINAFLASVELRRLGEAEYRRAITNALKQATHIIVLASKADYIESEWVYYEWDMFVNAKLKGLKQGNILTILKGVKVDDIPMDLWKYESFTLSNYQENLLKYVETPESRERSESARKSAEMEETKRISELKEALIKCVEEYHAAELRLEFDRKKILDIKRKLQLDKMKCPVCGEETDCQQSICSSCGWRFSPIEGIPGAEYLLNYSEEDITSHRRIFDRTSDSEEAERLKKKIWDLEVQLAKSTADIERLIAANHNTKTSQTSVSCKREVVGAHEPKSGKYEVRVMYADFVMTPLLQSWGVRQSDCPSGYYAGTLATFSDLERAQSLKSQLENYGAKVRICHNGSRIM